MIKCVNFERIEELETMKRDYATRLEDYRNAGDFESTYKCLNVIAKCDELILRFRNELVFVEV